jgi:hypothetical protein
VALYGPPQDVEGRRKGGSVANALPTVSPYLSELYPDVVDETLSASVMCLPTCHLHRVCRRGASQSVAAPDTSVVAWQVIETMEPLRDRGAGGVLAEHPRHVR